MGKLELHFCMCYIEIVRFVFLSKTSLTITRQNFLLKRLFVVNFLGRFLMHVYLLLSKLIILVWYNFLAFDLDDYHRKQFKLIKFFQWDFWFLCRDDIYLSIFFQVLNSITHKDQSLHKLSICNEFLLWEIACNSHIGHNVFDLWVFFLGFILFFSHAI